MATISNNPPIGITLLKTLVAHDAHVNRIEWSTDGCFLATPDDANSIRIWDYPAFAQCQLLSDREAARGSRVYGVAWAPDGTLLAAAMDSPDLRVYSLTTAKVSRRLDTDGERLHAVAWSPDGAMLAAGTLDGTIFVWNTDTWRVTRRLERHADWVNSLCWSPDSKQLVSGGGDNDMSVKVWNVEAGMGRSMVMSVPAGVEIQWFVMP